MGEKLTFFDKSKLPSAPVSPAAGKAYIKTFGCQMNEYDSAKIYDIVHAECGLSATQHVEDADLLIINTCSVRDKAQEKVYSLLGQWKKIKKKEAVIGVGGCVAAQEGEAMLSRSSMIDLVFGPQTLHRLPAMYDQFRQQRRPCVDVSFPEIEKFDHLPRVQTSAVSAYVTIMEGCSKFCSYCVVPYTRGKELSRPLMQVLDEVKDLVQCGAKEVNLLGQNVNGYLIQHDGEFIDFATLLYFIAAIDGVNRIRYTTSHPLHFTDRLIQAHADIPQLVRHVHLPVQSGSDRILSLMKRGYTVLEYNSIIKRLRNSVKGISITSDFIVGFPGETEADFCQTYELVKKIQFHPSYSFIFSPRPGTPASYQPDTTPLQEKKDRLARLQTLLGEQSRSIAQSLVGSVEKVLIEGPSKKNPEQISGRTDNNWTVNFDGSTEETGKILEVAITQAKANTLQGDIVSSHGSSF